MPNNIQACPFCGGNNSQVFCQLTQFVICGQCGLRGPLAQRADRAIHNWNSLPSAATQRVLRRENEQLTAKITSMFLAGSIWAVSLLFGLGFGWWLWR